MMEYRQLGGTELRISVLGFGASPLGDVFRKTEPAERNAAAHFAVDQGINFFDVSPYYGLTLAEARLGEALEGRREKVVLATKCGRYGDSEFDFSAKRIAAGFEESLKRLRTDYVDLLQAHDVEFGQVRQVVEETLPAMRRLQEQGKVRYVGITGYSLKNLMEIAGQAQVDSILSYCRYNLLITDLDRELAPFAKKHGIGVINASPLHMGILTERGAPEWHPAPQTVRDAGQRIVALCKARGVDASEVAMRFCLDYAGAASTLVGLSSREHVERNLKALEMKVDAGVVAGDCGGGGTGEGCDVGVGVGGELRVMGRGVLAALLPHLRIEMWGTQLVDLGAGNGGNAGCDEVRGGGSGGVRAAGLMVGAWDGRRFTLEELHRFANGGVSVRGSVEWDALRLWQEIQTGLMKFKARFGDAPAGIGVDAWGVDFGLLDKHGRLLGNPTCYRDPRTNGVPEKVFARVSEAEIFAATGVQTMQINTLFQLAAMAMTDDPRLECAETLLLIPDLLSYFLCGEKRVEYTEATTTQMFALEARDWDRAMLRRVGIPERILPRVVAPGTVLGEAGGDVLGICGFAQAFPVIAVASHDTASAVAAIPGLDAESAFLSSGTWSLMGVELDAPVTTERARKLGFTNEGGCAGKTLLMRNITGLWILQECVRPWEKEGKKCGWAEIIGAAKESAAFRQVILPNAPEFGAPGNMLEAIRGFCRNSGQTEPEAMGEFARCCFESLSLAYWSTLEGLRELTGADIRTIRVVGGGCLNQFLCQMTADACGCMVVSGPAEASALGNVMLQAVAVGAISDVGAGRASLGESLELVEYAPRGGDGWVEARERYRKLAAT